MELAAQEITARILNLAEVSRWPALAELVQRAGAVDRPDWTLPLQVCQALGGEYGTALPGAAAIACMQISIILVDDILDEDPRGEHTRRGYGRASNMAFALQGCAGILVGELGLPAGRRLRAAGVLARMAAETGWGQELDVQGSVQDEASYWQLVRAKSVPFYAAAFEMGALCAGVDDEEAGEMRAAGAILGEMVQVHDDMSDAFQSPANPDWLYQRQNLLLLYAQLADYPQKPRFMALRDHVGDGTVLDEAQQLLIRSGAVSYGIHNLMVRYQRLRSMVAGMELEHPEHLSILVNRQIEPVVALLRRNDISVPDAMADLA